MSALKLFEDILLNSSFSKSEAIVFASTRFPATTLG